MEAPTVCTDLAAHVPPDPSASLDLSLIKDVVAAHRLREVSCLALTSADGDLEDVHLAVRGKPISRGADWLPAIEQFGEGNFIHFDAGAIRRCASAASRPNIQEAPVCSYTGLSHASMAEIALDCGDPRAR
jgi:hypothetical protein